MPSEPHRRDLLVHCLALGRDMIRIAYRTHCGENLTKDRLAGEQREVPKVEPPERQQIEGIERGGKIERSAGDGGLALQPTPLLEAAEARKARVIVHHDLSIQDDTVVRKASNRPGDVGERPCDVVPVSRPQNRLPPRARLR